MPENLQSSFKKLNVEGNVEATSLQLGEKSFQLVDDQLDIINAAAPNAEETNIIPTMRQVIDYIARKNLTKVTDENPNGTYSIESSVSIDTDIENYVDPFGHPNQTSSPIFLNFLSENTNNEKYIKLNVKKNFEYNISEPGWVTTSNSHFDHNVDEYYLKDIALRDNVLDNITLRGSRIKRIAADSFTTPSYGTIASYIDEIYSSVSSNPIYINSMNGRFYFGNSNNGILGGWWYFNQDAPLLFFQKNINRLAVDTSASDAPTKLRVINDYQGAGTNGGFYIKEMSAGKLYVNKGTVRFGEYDSTKTIAEGFTKNTVDVEVVTRASRETTVTVHKTDSTTTQFVDANSSPEFCVKSNDSGHEIQVDSTPTIIRYGNTSEDDTLEVSQTGTTFRGRTLLSMNTNAQELTPFGLSSSYNSATDSTVMKISGNFAVQPSTWVTSNGTEDITFISGTSGAGTFIPKVTNSISYFLGISGSFVDGSSTPGWLEGTSGNEQGLTQLFSNDKIEIEDNNTRTWSVSKIKVRDGRKLNVFTEGGTLTLNSSFEVNIDPDTGSIILS